MLDPSAFKAYDVRALYPSQLDEEGAYAIGRAFVEQFEPKRIAVGRDVRLSSPSMAEAVISGAADGGADVADLGLVGTEMVYFATDKLGLDGGIMVTASHNPKQYTGMKIVRRGALPVGQRVRAGRGARPRRSRRVARGPQRRGASGETFGTGSSTACSRSSTQPRSRRFGLSSMRRTAWPAMMLPPRSRAAAAGRGCALLLRPGWVVPEPRAQPAPAGEPRVHRAQDP